MGLKRKKPWVEEPLPENKVFLFGDSFHEFRTFLYDLDQSKSNSIKKAERQNAIVKVIKDPLKTSYAYEVIKKNQDNILKWLQNN